MRSSVCDRWCWLDRITAALFGRQFERREVFDLTDDAVPVHFNNDKVDAGAFRVGTVGNAVVHGALPHPFELRIGNGFGSEAGRSSPGTDFHEDQVGAVTRNDVYFTSSHPDVGVDDLQAGRLKMTQGETLGKVADFSASAYHGNESCATGA
jgi:hypothetical protein